MDIKDIVNDGNILQEYWYGTVTRASFELNDTGEQEWDILTITVPFPKAKEKAAIKYFGIPKDGINDFYKRFLGQIRTYLETVPKLSALGEPQINNAIHPYTSRQITSENDSTTVHIIYAPADALTASELLNDTGTSKYQVLQLGMRLLQIAKTVEDKGYSIDTVLPESFTVNDDPYGRQLVKLGFAPMSVLDDAAGNRSIPKVCALLWTLLNGDRYDAEYNITKAPKHSTEAITELLRASIESGEDVCDELIKALSDELDSIDAGESEDAEIKYKKGRSPKPKKEKKVKKIQPANKKTGGVSIRKQLPLFILSGLLFLAAIVIMINQLIGGKTPTAPVDDPTAITSSTTGLYSYEGGVVDYYGNLSFRYELDDEGNIIFDPAGVPTSIEELEYTDDVINMTEETELQVTGKTLSVSNELIEKYGLSEGSVLYFSGSKAGDLPMVTAIEPVDEENSVLTLAEAPIWKIYKNIDSDLFDDIITLTREDECDRLTARTTVSNGRETTIYYDASGAVHDSSEWAEQEALKERIENIKAKFSEWKAMTEPQIIVSAEGVEEYVFIEAIEFSKPAYTITLDVSSITGRPVDTLFVIETSVSPANATCKEVDLYIDKAGLSFPYLYNEPYIIADAYQYSAFTTIYELLFDYSTGEDGKLTVVLNGNELGDFTIRADAAAGNVSNEVVITLTDETGHRDDIPDVIVLPEPDKQEDNQGTSSGGTSSGSNTAHSGGSSSGGTSSGNNTAGGTGSGNSTSNGSSSGGSSSGGNEATGSNQQNPPQNDNSQGNSETQGQTTEHTDPEPPQKEDPPIEEEPEPYITFTVSPTSLTLHVGETYNLTPNLSCTWWSSKNSVAQISGRTVKAMGVGTCTITAKSAEVPYQGQYVYITVTVIE